MWAAGLGVFEWDVHTDRADDFRGRIRSQVLDELSIAEVTASGHRVLRTPSLISTSDRRYFKLNLQLSGHGLLVQDNREAALRPGDLAVYDTHRPYTLGFGEEFRTLVLMFPHDALDLPAEEVSRLTAVRLAALLGSVANSPQRAWTMASVGRATRRMCSQIWGRSCRNQARVTAW